MSTWKDFVFNQDYTCNENPEQIYLNCRNQKTSKVISWGKIYNYFDFNQKKQ